MIALVLAPIVTMVQPAAPPPTRCALPQATATANHAPMRARKLGELPDAEMDLAVIRSMDGCFVRQVVRFHVSDRGPAAGGAEGVEVPGYTGRMVTEGPATAQPAR